MNFSLMEEIVRHIFSNLAVVPNSAINENKSSSLRDNEFLLPEKLSFIDADGKEIKNSVWGCHVMSIKSTEMITIILGDCTQYADIPEFCLFVQLTGTPAYGCYLVYNDLKQDCLADPLIAVSANNKDWMVCDTYLQATFLAGMEQIRDLNFGRKKCSDYKSQYDMMVSFIKYYSVFYGSQ